MYRRGIVLSFLWSIAFLLWGISVSITSAQIVLPPYTTDPNCTIQLSAWLDDTPLPAGAYHLEGTVGYVNGRLYVMGGYISGATFALGNRMDVYDFATRTWINGALPYTTTPRFNSHVQGAVVDDRYIWMAGGFPDDARSLPIDEVYRYDTVNNIFEVMPPLPQPRASGALVFNTVTRTLHYFGGLSDRVTDQPDHWVLNVDNIVAGWQNASPFPTPRNHFQGVEINGIIYGVGGQERHDGPHDDTALLHSYNPLTDAWTQLADMPLSRSHAESATFVINERIVIIAGSDSQNGNDQVANVTIYNPQTNVWSALTPIPFPLYAGIASTDGTRIMVTGGGLTNFNLQLNSWSADFVENCAPIVNPTPPPSPPPVSTLIATIPAPVSASVAVAQIGVFDPSISKLGFLLPGELGITGERLEWIVTVTNNGNGAGANVVITDTLRDELRIDNVSAPNGQITITGQTVQVRYPTLNAGQTVQFSIFTTVLDGFNVDNTACITADNLNGQICATGRAVSALPSTGETPLMRNIIGIVALLFIGLIGISLEILRRRELTT